MTNKSLWIALIAGALLVASLPAAHAYANMFNGNMSAGQWQSRHLSLSGHPGAWTQVRVQVRCITLTYPPADFDIYLVDQWGHVRAAGTSYGPDSINAWMPGTHCTLWIRCAHFHGTYQCSVAVENSPVAP